MPVSGRLVLKEMLSTSLHRDSLGSSSPPRALRREWKRYKVVRLIVTIDICNPHRRSVQHLPKSTSLPALRLLPSNRPIFTCSQCGFTNSHIPLCLWCSWTSEYATRAFEESMPRQRRVSAPAKAVWRHRATFHEAQGDSRRIAGRNYPVSSCPLLPLTTCSDLSPETDYMPLIASGLPDSVQPVRALLTKDKNNKRYSRRHGMVTGEAISDNNSVSSTAYRWRPVTHRYIAAFFSPSSITSFKTVVTCPSTLIHETHSTRICQRTSRKSCRVSAIKHHGTDMLNEPGVWTYLCQRDCQLSTSVGRRQITYHLTFAVVCVTESTSKDDSAEETDDATETEVFTFPSKSSISTFVKLYR